MIILLHKSTRLLRTPVIMNKFGRSRVWLYLLFCYLELKFNNLLLPLIKLNINQGSYSLPPWSCLLLLRPSYLRCKILDSLPRKTVTTFMDDPLQCTSVNVSELGFFNQKLLMNSKSRLDLNSAKTISITSWTKFTLWGQVGATFALFKSRSTLINIRIRPFFRQIEIWLADSWTNPLCTIEGKTHNKVTVFFKDSSMFVRLGKFFVVPIQIVFSKCLVELKTNSWLNLISFEIVFPSQRSVSNK